MIELSILICTTNARKEVIKPLIAELERQIAKRPDKVELIIDNHEYNTVGKKRNDLLLMAKGNYISFIDSDDEISPNYILKVLTVIECNRPDCIGINGIITTNGKDERKWFISKEYGCWKTEGDIYLRTPNHISPVKRELALLAMFPEISFGEDYEYSMRLLPLLTSEEKITEPLYFYRYRNDERK